ncbi:MAG TPA: dihydroorotase [Syntrophorhabdaceae bacterium]|nr:dihydroorotase [Syntrophorhabdaceae bacterium]HQM82511.1 dihydroorotase [Syntrophorhabdaceae bacterium]
MKILVKGGRLVDPGQGIDAKLDVLLSGNIVEKIDKDIPEKDAGMKVVDASGHIVAPGLIDVHAHLREPGYEYKETIRTGTMAAAKGGFTSVVCMANTDPVNDNKSVTEYIIKMARLEGACRVLPCGAVSKGLKGEELSDIGEMYEAGIVALSDDGKSVKNAGLLRRAFEYSLLFNIPIISHCEDDTLSGGFVNEGAASVKSGLDAIPSIAEEVIVLRDIAVARYADAPVHLTHISAQGSLEAIATAKGRYRKVTCDTCPHYFSLTDEATLGYDTNTKVNPPLRSQKDVDAVKEALRNNTVDIIATDHAPHEFTSKDVEYNLATFGISGFETAFALSLALVHEGVLTLKELLGKFTVNPARLLNIPYGTLAPGSTADLIVFNPSIEWTVDAAQFLSKGRNTPFSGWKLKGKNLLTIAGGKIAYRDPLFKKA